ncbi:MAG: hypothetical protein R2683_03340 [Bifidobacterium adolescentis]
MVTCCHGQLLIPFPNRIENGEYTFEGKTYTLPIDGMSAAMPSTATASARSGSLSP